MPLHRVAKLTPPRLPKVLARPRLFTQLDEGRMRPITWIMGPPGAGKTTLVASYLQTRKMPCLWYQLDEGDADVASFFHYLGLGMRAVAPRHRRPLPHLTVEYRLSLKTFTRRFFEEFWSRLKTPFILVFDNYHDVPQDSQLHEVMVTAVQQLPLGGICIMMSRGGPPASLAILQAGQDMHILDPDALRLTAHETAALVKLYARQHGHHFISVLEERTCAKTFGWAAGLVLLMEHAKTGDSTDAIRGDETPEVVFHYLGKEVMKSISPELHIFLLKTAVLPTMTAMMAQALTQMTTASRILDQLYQSRYFTERRREAELVYQYHPLFREFLLDQARQTFSPQALKDLQLNAANR